MALELRRSLRIAEALKRRREEDEQEAAGAAEVADISLAVRKKRRTQVAAVSKKNKPRKQQHVPVGVETVAANQQQQLSKLVTSPRPNSTPCDFKASLVALAGQAWVETKLSGLEAIESKLGSEDNETKESVQGRRAACHKVLALPLPMHVFQCQGLLRIALAYGSSSPDLRQAAINLAWLGDSVLYLLGTEAAISLLPLSRPGIWHPKRDAWVTRQACARVVKGLQLEKHKVPIPSLRGASEGAAAELFEALLGALYLDGGLPAATAFQKRCQRFIVYKS